LRIPVRARLGAFAVALVVVFASAFAVGRVLGPVGKGARPSPSTKLRGHGGAGHPSADHESGS
jgi:hypothetical protein